MDAQLTTMLTELFAAAGGNLLSAGILAAIQSIFAANPEIEAKLTRPSSQQELESTLNELIGKLELLAGNGEIKINGAALEALKSAHLDHQSGLITIGNTTISAPTIQTGGSGTGKTILGGNTQLKSQGTSIDIQPGASIVINGNASIKQS